MTGGCFAAGRRVSASSALNSASLIAAASASMLSSSRRASRNGARSIVFLLPFFFERFAITKVSHHAPTAAMGCVRPGYWLPHPPQGAT